MHREAMGKEGMLMAALVSLIMFFVAHFVASPSTLEGNMGLCLRSPNEWGITPLWGWIANMLTLWLGCLTLYIVNKEFTFVHSSDTVLTAMYILMVSSNIWLSGSLSSSGLMVLANLICLLILFGCYRKKNATQELFVIATILSLGSMIQYAFLFMLPVYLIGAMMLKCFNFKVLVAIIMGIVAPYWVGLGLGLISPESFTMPTFTNLFDGYVTRSTLFIGLINVAITVLIGLLLGLTNWVKLYAGNTQRRLYNMVINLLGICAIICIIVDWNNMVSYLALLYMITAVQLANLFALHSIPKGGRWMAALSLLYISGFVLTVV